MKRSNWSWVEVVYLVAAIATITQWIFPGRSPVDDTNSLLERLWATAGELVNLGIPIGAWLVLGGVYVVGLRMFRPPPRHVFGRVLDRSKYVSDRMFEVDWTWRYTGGSATDFRAFCPFDKHELEQHPTTLGTVLNCSECDRSWRISQRWVSDPSLIAKTEVRWRLVDGRWEDWRWHLDEKPKASTDESVRRSHEFFGRAISP